MVRAMVRRINHPVMATALGDDRNWNLDDTMLDNIDKGIRLTPDLRAEIRKALFSHLSLANLEMNAPKAKPILTFTKKIQRSVDALIATLRPLDWQTLIDDDENKLDTLWLTFLREGYSKSDLQNLVANLQLLKAHSEKVDEALRRNVSGGRGRARHPHLEPFIHQLATIYEKAGGTASAAYDAYADRRQTPFVIFAFELLGCLPPELHIPINALGEAMKRALKSRVAKRRSNS